MRAWAARSSLCSAKGLILTQCLQDVLNSMHTSQLLFNQEEDDVVICLADLLPRNAKLWLCDCLIPCFM